MLPSVIFCQIAHKTKKHEDWHQYHNPHLKQNLIYQQMLPFTVDAKTYAEKKVFFTKWIKASYSHNQVW